MRLKLIYITIYMTFILFEKKFFIVFVIIFILYLLSQKSFIGIKGVKFCGFLAETLFSSKILYFL